jgi:hypothetical protein
MPHQVGDSVKVTASSNELPPAAAQKSGETGTVVSQTELPKSSGGTHNSVQFPDGETRAYLNTEITKA